MKQLPALCATALLAMPELRLNHTTIGKPGGEPVLVLHGTAGSARFYAQALHELLQTAPRLVP